MQSTSNFNLQGEHKDKPKTEVSDSVIVSMSSRV